MKWPEGRVMVSNCARLAPRTITKRRRVMRFLFLPLEDRRSELQRIVLRYFCNKDRLH